MALLILFFSTLSVFAFNEDRCGDLFPKVEDKHPPYMSPLYTSTMMPSTTSYVSSIGKCAMYGNRELRQRYIATHYGLVSIEAAQGSGEYVELLRELSGCPKTKSSEFRQLLRSNFDVLFSAPQKPREDFSQSLDDLILKEKVLTNACQMHT